jgi:phage host-nuclease inhibitor protein Gam
MTRRKSQTSMLQSEAEAQTVLARYIEHDNALRQAALERDNVVAAANERFAATAATLKPLTKTCVQILHSYFDTNRTEILGRRKSVSWQDAALGFRTGMPKLKFTQATEDEVIDDFCDDDLLDTFVRKKYSLDKQALIKTLSSTDHVDDDMMSIAATCHDHGITIEQSETFFIDRDDLTNAGDAA